MSHTNPLIPQTFSGQGQYSKTAAGGSVNVKANGHRPMLCVLVIFNILRYAYWIRMSDKIRNLKKYIDRTFCVPSIRLSTVDFPEN